ncbi:MAG: Unknown protein [uncultured Campylobacterales bacterium]|uniref:EamA domain-containing protein n=1 Tax=uncultured Campylobacterales bacterium TaxID=352960 RepID=A0A6S6SCJ6_9BACT|nr:MAG: Unknown protein [uncultured Campylobacterales bacterium]
MGSFFFSEYLSVFGWVMVIFSVLGIIILTIPKLKTQQKINLLPTMIGLFSGLCFAISTICVAKAVSGIDGGDLFLNVGICLFLVLTFQSLILLVFLLLKNKKDIKVLYKKRYKSIFLGFFGGLASICWFSAFCLINPALVKTIGSVEMIFTVIMGYVFFNDRLGFYEYLGMVVIIVSSLGVLYA